MISSKRLTEYVDFPMPKEYPPFPSHRLALEYLRSYAREFQLYDAIEFNSTVEKVVPRDDGWAVQIKGESEPRTFAGVVIANGHHWDARRPQLPGNFNGEQLHSSQYKTHDILQGKRVLVVGAGNSGCDIAVEASRHAASATISMRRGYHFLPKFLYGAPVDSVGERMLMFGMPLWARRLAARYALRIAVGQPSRYGAPKPDHKLFETHPIINSQLLYHAGHGDVVIRSDVSELCGDEVRFADGEQEPFDLIIYATGFHVSFPFIENDLLNDQGDGVELFLNAIHPERDDLFVVGLIQPDSGIWGLADYQAQLIASYLVAKRHAPDRAKWLKNQIQKGHRSLSAGVSYVGSPRHRYEVEHFSFRRRLRKLLAKMPTKLCW